MNGLMDSTIDSVTIYRPFWQALFAWGSDEPVEHVLHDPLSGQPASCPASHSVYAIIGLQLRGQFVLREQSQRCSAVSIAFPLVSTVFTCVELYSSERSTICVYTESQANHIYPSVAQPWQFFSSHIAYKVPRDSHTIRKPRLELIGRPQDPACAFVALFYTSSQLCSRKRVWENMQRATEPIKPDALFRPLCSDVQQKIQNVFWGVLWTMWLVDRLDQRCAIG